METQVTVKQIHNEFYKELQGVGVTEAQKSTLNQIGFIGSPPPEYQRMFPLHKLIHKNRILKVCEKYDLIFSNIENYAADIPAKNVAEIQAFMESHNYHHVSNQREVFNKRKMFVKEGEAATWNYKESAFYWMVAAAETMMVTKSTTERLQATNFDRLHTPDPVIIAIIKPEIYNDLWQCKWGVIVTAWGEEAGDPQIANEKMN